MNARALRRATLDCRLALREPLPPAARERLEAELQDLRLAALGVRSERGRFTLLRLGLGGRELRRSGEFA